MYVFTLSICSCASFSISYSSSSLYSPIYIDHNCWVGDVYAVTFQKKSKTSKQTEDRDDVKLKKTKNKILDQLLCWV